MRTAHHFCGTLMAANALPLAGIHQITVELADDDGTNHTAYLVFGRSDDAARRCRLTFDALQLGQRYHGSATSRSVVQGAPCHFGSVVLAVDRRRPRFAAAPVAMAGAAA